MRYIVAVSGGVDSVVLLDTLVSQSNNTLIIAHFDHGIRPESDADARFVEGLAKHYALPFEMRREELGAQASEALARERRYAFLRDMAKKHDATIVTAHHKDDMVETMIINMIRGTGWRGLAVLDTQDITRPLLSMTKNDIYTYALSHQLEWVEDETNASDAYLRNRIRRRLHGHLAPSTMEQLMELHEAQIQLKHLIHDEVSAHLGENETYSRYFFTHVSEIVAIEVLRHVTSRSITRPQAMRALHAIKTAQAGSVSDVGAGVRLHFTTREFTVQTP